MQRQCNEKPAGFNLWRMFWGWSPIPQSLKPCPFKTVRKESSMNQPITENGQLFVLVLCSALRTKEAHTSALPVIRSERRTLSGEYKRGLQLQFTLQRCLNT